MTQQNQPNDKLDKADTEGHFQKILAAKRELTAKQMRFADLILAGETQTAAYIKSTGTKSKSPTTAASAWARQPKVKAYLDAVRASTHAHAMEKVHYTEEDWLNTQMEILHSSMGRKKSKKALVIAGEAVSVELEETNLTQANKAQELIAKRFGWLKDNDDKAGRTVVQLNHIDLTGKKKKK